MASQSQRGSRGRGGKTTQRSRRAEIAETVKPDYARVARTEAGAPAAHAARWVEWPSTGRPARRPTCVERIRDTQTTKRHSGLVHSGIRSTHAAFGGRTTAVSSAILAPLRSLRCNPRRLKAATNRNSTLRSFHAEDL